MISYGDLRKGRRIVHTATGVEATIERLGNGMVQVIISGPGELDATDRPMSWSELVNNWELA